MLWLLLLAIPASLADFVCDPGFTLHPGTHWCYQVSHTVAAWSLAQYRCLEYFAELVSIHDAQENAFVASLTHEALIGMRYKNGQFAWSDESAVDYKNLGSDFVQSGITCVKIVDGVWENADCTRDSMKYICKMAATDIPVTVNNVCPDSSIIYSDYGELYSPGFPNGYDASNGMHCVYYLKATAGDTVIVDFDEVNFDRDNHGVVRVYEGWTEDPSNLLYEVTWDLDFPIEAKTSNLMLLVFDGFTTGYWKASWYSDKSRPDTLPPGVSTTPHTNSPGCPTGIDYGDPQEAVSPNFPFAYDANFDCDYPVWLYYRECGEGWTCQYTWQLIFEQLNIGADDWIDIVDVGSNTIVESTKENIVEGSVLDCPYNLTIRFHSGSVAGIFDHWRIRMIFEELESNYHPF